MQDFGSLCRVAMVLVCLAVPAVVAADDDPSQILRKGIELFDQGNYLAAQEVFLGVDRDALNAEERGLRDDYVDRVSVAINMMDRANQELEEGRAALAGDDFDEARILFDSVLDNEYALATVRRAAEEGLREVSAREDRGQKATAPDGEQASADSAEVERVTTMTVRSAPVAGQPADGSASEARILTQRGYGMLDAGRLEEALGLFNQALTVVPGYPEAVAGVEQVRAHERVEAGTVGMIGRIKGRNQIRWQRVVASFRDAETEVRGNVIENRFDLAKQALLRARQTVEAGREFADPRSQYESLRAEADALAEFLDAEERNYNEDQVRRKRDEISERDAERIAEQRRTRQRRVDALMEQAADHRKNGNFEAAIGVLDQVVAIDPRNNRASWLRDELQDTWNFVRQRSALDTKRKITQDLLSDVEESKIPWFNFIQYPKNWLEITSRPDRRVVGQEYISPEDRVLHKKLATRIPVQFDDVPFNEVIETLQDSQELNITVVWTDLQDNNIMEDDPVTLVLPMEITLGKALDEVLAQLGGGSTELGYVVSDGLIKIATRSLLDRDVVVEVYDIADLLMRVPDFTDSPAVNLQQGGGGGGTSGSAQQNPFQGGSGGGGGDQDNRTRTERAGDIVDLIRETIEPESWRAAGGLEASIHALEANLVVTQTASAHGEIADLLAQLRQERAIQIGVEARFLTVTANYLEELGIDLDIILNQGNAGYDRVNGLDGGSALLLPRSFSRLGFTPAVPGVGTPLNARGVPTPSNTGISQPYSNVALVPAAGSSITSGSRMTPIPVLNNVLQLTESATTSIPGSLGGAENPALQVFGSFLDNIQVDFLLKATQADRRGSSMSAPRLVMFNGQRAWVGVLREQAYVNQVQAIADENAIAQQPQTQMILTGAVLDVAATVSADKRYVTMTLRPGVATLDGIQEFPYSGGAAGGAAGGGFIQLPTRQLQVVRTTVQVPDGGTLLIGGMKSTEEVEIEAGVPVLSKIPVLKRLYSNRSLVKDEQVLLILVKPTIIISREAEEEAFPTFGSRG